MGRISGVSAAETRERLLRAAAEVFGERGYDGTRVADIAATAGVSNGALYAHFASKAELLVAALRAHGRRLLADVVAHQPGDVLVAPRRDQRLDDEVAAGVATPGQPPADEHQQIHDRLVGISGERIGEQLLFVCSQRGHQ